MHLSSLANTYLNKWRNVLHQYFKFSTLAIWSFSEFFLSDSEISAFLVYFSLPYCIWKDYILNIKLWKYFFSDSTNLIERIMDGFFSHVILRVLKLFNDICEQQAIESWPTYHMDIF